MRGAKNPSLANLFSSLFKTHTNNANQRKQEHNEVTGNPSQLVLISIYKIQNCFPESEGNAYIPSIQRFFPFSLPLFLRLLSQRVMLTSQAFRDYIPLLPLKAAGALLKDSPCSFSLGGYATAQNRPELLAQPSTTQMVAC